MNLNVPNANEVTLDKFTKFDKIDLIKKFFTNKRFLEMVKMQIFNEKCCNNYNCKYNIGQLFDGKVADPKENNNNN